MALALTAANYLTLDISNNDKLGAGMCSGFLETYTPASQVCIHAAMSSLLTDLSAYYGRRR